VGSRKLTVGVSVLPSVSVRLDDVVELPAVSVATTDHERVPVVAAKVQVYCPAVVCVHVVPEGGELQLTATVPDDSTHSSTTLAIPRGEPTSATSEIEALPASVAPLPGETRVTLGALVVPPASVTATPPPSGDVPPPAPASD
jgi:hypothetical protein